MPVTPNRLLDLADGVGQVGVMFRYRLLDRALNPAGIVSPLNECSISASSERDTKRTLSGFNLGAREMRQINPFSDRIQPVVVLEDGTEWPCGVFVFTDAPEHIGTYVSTLEADLADQDSILNQKSRFTYQVNPGGSITAAISDILDQAGIIHRNLPDSPRLLVPGTDALIWASGTSRMQMLKVLCNLGGWLPPYFDNDGVCVVKPPPAIDSGFPDHIYDDRRVAYDSPVVNGNLLTAPNVFVVIGTGPSKGEIFASAQVDARLPFSVENRGFEVVDVFRTQGIVSTEQAQFMANQRAMAGAVGFMNLDFEGPIDPRHDLFQTVYYPTLQASFREVSFNLKLTAGANMSHSLTQGGFSGGST